MESNSERGLDTSHTIKSVNVTARKLQVGGATMDSSAIFVFQSHNLTMPSKVDAECSDSALYALLHKLIKWMQNGKLVYFSPSEYSYAKPFRGFRLNLALEMTVLFWVVASCKLPGSPEDGYSMFLRNVDITYETTRRHNPEHHHHLHRREKL
jgi:hypothetical protein